MRYWIIILVCLSTGAAFTQYSNGRSRSELGILIGGSYYHGDLNPYRPFNNTNLAGGLVYRYTVHPRLSFRANLTYGKVEGYDSESNDPVFVDRNLSFVNEIYEFGTGVEFNYFPFELGHDRYKGTAYLMAEFAIFQMNPTAISDDGAEVELQPLGTEGQGTSLNSKKHYSLTQIAIPLGIGCKISLGKRASLNFEFGIRKTFTDYIDDVGAGGYVDPVLLAAENGPLAAEMSNRSLSGSRYGKRGNSNTKDWYVFTGAMLMFRLGQKNICMTR